MSKGRLEAFSDGVIAILITIMVLELKVPHGDTFEAIRPMLSVFLAYVLSFVYLGIYWNNHHHLLHAATRVTGGALWANLNLLFWLSLVPVVTHWIGESHHAPLPTAAYGAVMLLAAISYVILQTALRRDTAHNPALSRAVGSDTKGKTSLALYVASIPLAYVNTWISIAIYVLVAVMWFIPDPRIEQAPPSTPADP